jgi:hypothetical protein
MARGQSAFKQSDVTGGVVRVSVLLAPRGILLVVHMPNDHHGNQTDGCADDWCRSYQPFPFHFFLIPPTLGNRFAGPIA